ncbi:hypothetical protein ACFFF7_04565 [Novosphingobium aquiterrae]|uniref:O-antigen ligase family protein n=1 Tax=Novosphingobium aquiterrae TaxID=624388 RepID=A0ABV6PFQ8_9SPHN
MDIDSPDRGTPQRPDGRPIALPRHAQTGTAAVGGVAWSYILLAAAWMADFRSAGEGQAVAIQAVFLSVYLFALIIFATARIGGPARIEGLNGLIVLGGLYLTVGFLSGFVRSDSFYQLLRNGVGVFVYLSAAWATAKVAIEADPARLRRTLSWLCLPYALAAFVIFNATSGGIDFSRVRYQIIGSSSMAALGLFVTLAIFRLSAVQIFTLIANFGILLVSVTRTFLIVLVAQGAVMLTGLRHIVSRRLMVALTGMIGMAAGAVIFAGDQLARWQARLGGAGGSETVRDQTYFTRLSEWQFMLGSWTSSIKNVLFGSGFAARTRYFETKELGGGEQFMIGFGHNQHISMLFNGGIVGGLPLLLLMLWFGVLAIRFLRNAARAGKPDSDVIFLGAWGATIIIGFLVSDVFAASFILRGEALWYGIGTGLLLGVQARFDPANAHLYAPRRPAVPAEAR